ncbi:D-alanyl-D-alanine carboxypeptidase family protein [Desulfosporosinus sp. BICA1-9]|uniref:D-alanyl-D-alanine carboxypeptidase family protein n=1 Tax=Desulfosporosinus sp. BICA1-9 TaxID=1531958 RepID=UPI00054C5140|nr:D-alanyl-D-alanine carboxypeptidase family protein [Desulfosporosinus sp. BICA1-9]KJS47319.1 MAG: D-alanyl-D-alanine carboxypeptidase [Peptococcaceae bacterium BRH_c23]KJS86552.1 MAG: D-alanyl-D-alanine carboxypeptidase [Desulfosporosinus sp. BICA1-9]HBW36931.1 D-alanyl-D-alanine carboxypeptidase [Desulfosporosinus sp.]
MIRLKWTRAWCCVVLCTIVISLMSVNPVYSAPAQKSVQKPAADTVGVARITADAAVLMDVVTGDVLFSKQAHKQRPPASTTKIMTAILGLELGRPDEIVTVSPKAAVVGESSLYLDPGEKINLYELITGALVRSGNDACVAISEHIAGSEEQFLKWMNRKALALGAQNTHFVNTNGLPRKEHYSTAYDLALMARYGLQIPQFVSITRLKETEIHFIEPDVMMDLRNTNKLLWNYPYADGVKTGTTTAAGKCLVASATKEGRQLLVVVLNAPDRFGDAKKLLEWGFQNTETVHLANAGQIMSEFPSVIEPVSVFIKDPIDVSLSKVERKNLQTRVVWEKTTNLPVRAGERLGRLEIWLREQKLNSMPLLSENEVAEERSLIRLFPYSQGNKRE